MCCAAMRVLTLLGVVNSDDAFKSFCVLTVYIECYSVKKMNIVFFINIWQVGVMN